MLNDGGSVCWFVGLTNNLMRTDTSGSLACLQGEEHKLVPKAGLEPARLAPHAPQTCVSAISPLRLPAGAGKLPQLRARIAQTLNVLSRTPQAFARCGLVQEFLKLLRRGHEIDRHSGFVSAWDASRTTCDDPREEHYRSRAKFLSIKETSGRIAPLLRYDSSSPLS